MTKLDNPQIYVSENFPSFSFRVGRKRYKFINHELHINTKEEVEALDGVLEQVPALKSKFRKVDKAAAEALVKKLMQKRGPARPTAIKGTVSAQDILHSQKPLDQRDAELDNLDPQQKANIVQKMQEDSSLILTEKAKNPATSSVDNPPVKNEEKKITSLASLMG